MFEFLGLYIDEANAELQNPETSSERVQELFRKWWGRRIGRAVLENDVYILPVRVTSRGGFAGVPYHCDGGLQFPKAKLSARQIAKLDSPWSDIGLKAMLGKYLWPWLA